MFIMRKIKPYLPERPPARPSTPFASPTRLSGGDGYLFGQVPFGTGGKGKIRNGFKAVPKAGLSFGMALAF